MYVPWIPPAIHSFIRLSDLTITPPLAVSSHFQNQNPTKTKPKNQQVACIDEWLTRKKLCPLCLTPLDVILNPPDFGGEGAAVGATA